MSDKTTPQQRRGALAAGVLIALALIVIPNFEVFSRLSYYDAKRLIQIGLYGALTLVLLASLALRERWLQRFSALPAPASWALGLLLAAGVLSALVGDTHDARLAYSLAEVALFAGLLGVAFTTTAVLSVFRKHANTIMLTVITVAIGLYVFRFLSRYSVAISLNEPVYIDALIANFSHLRFFGQWISWTLPLVVITPMLLPARRLRYLPYIIASTWWTLLFLSGTRSTIAAMAGAMILVPLLLGRAGLKWLRLQVVSLVVGLAFYVGGFTLIATTHAKTGIGRLAAKTPFGRDDMWRDAWAMMQDNLLLGAGPQSYAFNLDHLASHPHNAVVQWAAEWGLPSVIVMLALIIFGFVAWVRFARQRYSK
ncbi:MAG: O-antigen ligase family protein, partial [Candidatus Tectomicrobia bacterium]|nr:O-antigen ligase family protein [Candidatus Tectomicrobia bacterium]